MIGIALLVRLGRFAKVLPQPTTTCFKVQPPLKPTTLVKMPDGRILGEGNGQCHGGS